MAREQLTWRDIDTNNFSTPELAEAYATMIGAKADFEAAVIENLRTRGIVGANQSALFTYRRGLAFAVVEKRGDSTKVSI